MKNKKAVFVPLAAAAAIASYRFIEARPAKDKSVIRVSGNIEVTDVRKGPRQEDVDQTRARLEQARQALAIAETRLSYAAAAAPLSGVVLSENIEPGMYAAPGTPVVTVGDLVNVWLRAYINETDLGRVKVGQSVRVTTEAYPGKHYEGRVSFIASQAEFTPKNVQTEKERVKLVYRVKIDIQNPQMELKPGMPADAEILLAAQSAGQMEISDAGYQD